jgi:uncharacterized membrane protein
MPSDQFLIWIHILGLAAYFGLQFGLLYMLLPAAERAPDEPSRRAALIAGFKFYNPFSIAMLGVLVITGAVRLTDLKAEMKFDYFARISGPLSLKLLLAFVLIFIQTWLTFGLTFRIGRQEEVAAHGDGPPFTVERVNSILRRVRAMAWITIVLTAAIVLVSLRMASAARTAFSTAALPAAGAQASRLVAAGACARMEA